MDIGYIRKQHQDMGMLSGAVLSGSLLWPCYRYTEGAAGEGLEPTAVGRGGGWVTFRLHVVVAARWDVAEALLSTKGWVGMQGKLSVEIWTCSQRL